MSAAPAGKNRLPKGAQPENPDSTVFICPNSSFSTNSTDTDSPTSQTQSKSVKEALDGMSATLQLIARPSTPNQCRSMTYFATPFDVSSRGEILLNVSII